MFFCRIVGLLAFCPPVLSFTPSGQISRGGYHQLNLSDRGWDNGNYLDALGGGQDSIDEANAKYMRESEARSSFRERQFQSMVHDVKYQEVLDTNQDEDFIGMGNVGDESPIPVPNAAMDENPSGGDRLRRMMEQAKAQQGQVPNLQAQQQQQQQQQVQQQQFQQQPQPPPVPMQTPTPLPQTPTGQQTMDPQGYYQALQAWQQAMVAFQQFSAANPDAASQMTPPPPPPPPPTFTEQMPQQQAVPQVPQQQYQVPVPQEQYTNPDAASQMTPPPPPPPQQQAVPQVPQQQAVPQVPQQQYQVPVPQEQYNTPQPQQQPNQSNESDGTKTVYDYLPTRAGGNKDAYEVNNSADVYFAQLKRDSTLRTEARKRGDLETANSPFAEEGVKALGGFFSDELIARRREQLAKNGGEFETSRDEMLLPQHLAADEGDQGVDKAYPGTSYKQKLMEAKRNKANK
eukprot:CAMPEP_0203682942 /NCGR_PEP_ID=MMETSP0090-20130426/47261_1 /ASSEMBLY_ACC=CAM_ASM_001088 /TAXON_ID=426623 /ORGANISM="Chaetoceros affinis, Strain CCMP159" /LENGTH=457 /DNA_ID=CAMNT_0050552061 /DNA_START=43 /DNA_END=1416 /DNA_ORIENTATION=-